MIKHILLADDLERWGTDLRDLLVTEGYEVSVARSGEQVLADVSDEISLVLLSTTLPGMNGFETFERLRDNPLTCKIPVILVSGLSDVQTRLRTLDMGAEDFIIRPFDDAEILARVDAVLQRRTVGAKPRRRQRRSDARMILLKGLVEQGVDRLAPAIDAASPLGYGYPDAAVAMASAPHIEFDALVELERLSDEGYLHRAFADRVHLCPECHHYNLNFRTLCPFCESAALRQMETLHHFKCGHVAPIGEYRVSSGLECPKCKTAMRVAGADYENVPDQFFCDACESAFGQPIFSVTCFRCGHVASEETVDLADVWSYELTNKARLAAAGGEFAGLTLEGALAAESRPVLDLEDFQAEVRRELERSERYERPFTVALVSLDQYRVFLESSEGRDPVGYFHEVVRTIVAGTRGSDVIGEFRDDAVV
ncbi:MAG: response regulator, partial [Myxococcales bacterium]|nr:response regulator [Myxococcales bacterium]